MPRAAPAIEVLAESPVDRPLHSTTPIRHSPACVNHARPLPNTGPTPPSRRARSYDTHTPLTVTECRPGDVNMDGTVDPADKGLLQFYYGQACEQALGPWLLDLNADGTIDAADVALLKYYYGDTLQEAQRSGVAIGNPYFFTGRTLDIFYDNEAGIDLSLQDNRNRTYYPLIGRWMQRDPLGTVPVMRMPWSGPRHPALDPRVRIADLYADGMNCYEYVGARPTTLSDSSGLWGADVHSYRTAKWAAEAGMDSHPAASWVAFHDNETDRGSTGPLPGRFGDQSRHFNRRSSGRDTRLEWTYEKELRWAREACAKDVDEKYRAVGHLGRALHSIQDWWAHGDYSKGPKDTCTHHGRGYDDRTKDADPRWSSDGRAPQWFEFSIKGGQVIRGKEIPFPYWVAGSKRISGTERSTKAIVRDFLRYVRTQGGCDCKRHFLPLPPP